MLLSENMRVVSSRLLSKFGDSITLVKATRNSAYNPAVAGGYTYTTVSFSDKAYIKNPIEKELEFSGIDSKLWSSVTGVATVSFKSSYAQIDNTWSINGKRVIGVIKTSMQDNAIVLKVFF